MVAAIAERLAQRPAAEWIAALDAAGVPCGVVKGVTEALGAADAAPRTGVSPSVPGSVRLDPPMLDEDGPLIREHGWDAFERVTRRREP